MKITVDFKAGRKAVIDTDEVTITGDELVVIQMERYLSILNRQWSPSEGDPIGSLPVRIRKDYPKATVTVTDEPDAPPSGTIY